jgi:GDP-L-fucose synthase
MYEKSRVLVTGGSGLVGKSLQDILTSDERSRFIFVSSQDGDLTNWEETYSVFERTNPQAVIHLAARVGGLYSNMEENLEYLQSNLVINMNVVRACHEFNVQNAIFCLSTCIFPASAELPITEDQIHDGAPHMSNEGYSHSKRILECLVRMHAVRFGYKWCCAIPTNLYGPHDTFDLRRAHVIPALIRKCIVAKKKDTDFVICGSGSSFRQFLFARDFAHMMVDLLARNACGNYICCTNEPEISICDLANKIAAIAGFIGQIAFEQSSADGVSRKTACSNKLTAFLNGSNTNTSLEDGLTETVSWFLRTHPNIL